MKIPDEFRRFGEMLHQDTFVFFSSMDALIAEFVRELSDKQRRNLERFLEKSLDGRLSNAELKGHLNRGVLGIHIRKSKDARSILENLLNQVKD